MQTEEKTECEYEARSEVVKMVSDGGKWHVLGTRNTVQSILWQHTACSCHLLFHHLLCTINMAKTLLLSHAHDKYDLGWALIPRQIGYCVTKLYYNGLQFLAKERESGAAVITALIVEHTGFLYLYNRCKWSTCCGNFTYASHRYVL